MPDVKAIEFVAEIRQIKTAVDHSITVSINIPETCIEQAKRFIDWQGKMVRIVAVEED